MGPALECSAGVPYQRRPSHQIRLVPPRRWLRLAAAAVLAVCVAAPAHAGDGPTPPRLSLVEGDVAFWRPGTEAWEAAQLNTPLADGDRLRSGPDGRFEIQVGRAAFIRGAAATQVVVETRNGEAAKLGMDAGQLTLDVREATRNTGITIATPRGSLTVSEPGTYRVEIRGTATYFIARRGGRGRIQPADGANPVELSAGAQVVLQDAQITESHVAVDTGPALDDWDHWNDDRTDTILASTSYGYVPRDVYGAEALDSYGDWRQESRYGYVWVPRMVSPGWVPYSSGRWLWDPYYGWSWVDTAPWGWAPFHYGRWVYLGSRWGWAPGPVVLTPFYSPALVAFFGGPGWAGGFGSPFVSWVALGWGEPLVPWWGPPGFVGVPCWHGWGGPRVGHGPPVHYVNTRIQHAVISTPRDRFRSGATEFVRQGKVDPAQLHPLPHRDIPAYAGIDREVGSRRPPAWRPRRFEAGEPFAPTTGAPAGASTDQREPRAGTRTGSTRFPLRQTDPRERYRPGTQAPNAPAAVPQPGGVVVMPDSPPGAGSPRAADIERHAPRSHVPPPLPPRYRGSDGDGSPAGVTERPGALPDGPMHPRRPGHSSGGGSSRFGDTSGDGGSNAPAAGPPPVLQPQVVQPPVGQPMMPRPAPLSDAPGAGGVPGRAGGIWPGSGPANVQPGAPGQMMPAAPSGLPAVPAAPMGGIGGRR